MIYKYKAKSADGQVDRSSRRNNTGSNTFLIRVRNAQNYEMTSQRRALTQSQIHLTTTRSQRESLDNSTLLHLRDLDFSDASMTWGRGDDRFWRE